MRGSISLASLFLLLMPAIVFADADDDTLRFFLSKSDLVVKGKITSDPVAIFWEDGVPNYICSFEINDVLKGDTKLRGKTVRVNIIRFEAGEGDHHPLIKKDGESILFLKGARAGDTPRWQTADFWFGVQHPSSTMARSLKRLALAERAESARAGSDDESSGKQE